MIITAIVRSYTQTGPDKYKDIIYTRNFDSSRSIGSIVKWAQSMLPGQIITINDIEFGDYTGSSS